MKKPVVDLVDDETRKVIRETVVGLIEKNRGPMRIARLVNEVIRWHGRQAEDIVHTLLRDDSAFKKNKGQTVRLISQEEQERQQCATERIKFLQQVFDCRFEKIQREFYRCSGFYFKIVVTNTHILVADADITVDEGVTLCWSSPHAAQEFQTTSAAIRYVHMRAAFRQTLLVLQQETCNHWVDSVMPGDDLSNERCQRCGHFYLDGE